MSIQTIKLTSKRQATFPAEFCREFGLRPGDRIVLERREMDGHHAWVLHPPSGDERPSWFGVLRPFANSKSHDMDDVRRSIGRKVAEGES